AISIGADGSPKSGLNRAVASSRATISASSRMVKIDSWRRNDSKSAATSAESGYGDDIGGGAAPAQRGVMRLVLRRPINCGGADGSNQSGMPQRLRRSRACFGGISVRRAPQFEIAKQVC